MLLEQEYQQFLVKSDITSRHLDITTEGWKLLAKENLTPIIEKELQMKQINDFVWASEYQMGIRKVLSFLKINDAYATFKWGWNFNFIPRYSSNKIVWARTDKTIYTHIYELSSDFYNSDYTDNAKRKARDKVVMTRFNIDDENPSEGIKKNITHHQEVFYYLLPIIKEYYYSTSTLEEIINRIDLNLQNKYYCFVNPDLTISKIFIEYHMGLQEKAIYDFEKITFRSDDIKSQYYKKLLLPK